MNSKLCLGSLNHFFIRAFTLAFSLITLLSSTAYGSEGNYQLTKIAQLEHQLISQANWQQLIANPSNKNQHFVIRESGQVYLIDDGEINPKVVLDMRAPQQADSSLLKLTAIELHPNFSLRDQIGYGTFYTAHIENSNKNSKTKRIQAQSDDLSLSFDAVITEWQLGVVNHQKIDTNTKREVLRIGVPDNLIVIKQMSFNPYIKSWNDNFGLLYVALSGEQKWPQPLYSGVILRIDPAKYGMRSFSVPTNNPYIKNSQIHDAIYLLGGQKIEQFIWPDKSDDHILISHQYDNKYLLSLTKGKDDWRDSAIKPAFYQSDHAIQDMLLYRGRQLPSLRSKLLLLRQKEQRWFVDSLTFNLLDHKTMRDDKKSQVEWLIASEQLPTTSEISLSSSHDGEILLLEKTLSVLFRLTQQLLVNENVVVENTENNTSEVNSSNKSLFILLFIVILLAIIYYFLKRNSHSVKAIVRQQFASFELNESCLQISLYQRHQRNAEKIIDIVDIVSSEIKLNEHGICLVKAQPGHGFTNDKEQDLRTIFINEKVDKMVDGKVRQVTLLLTDKQKNCYTICLYMRKGSNRITKKSYVKVIDELIDWSWFIGDKINADNTDKRKVKPIISRKKTGIKYNKENNTPLHEQAEAIKPLTPKMDNASQSLASEALPSTMNVVNEHKHSVELASEKSSEAQSQVNQSKTIDTELVDALEKLVDLKQQGFLTMEEFSKAKETLLKSLFEK